MKKLLVSFLLLSNFIFAFEKNYYHLEGKIGTSPISMDINIFSDKDVSSIYSYDKSGEPISLKGSYKNNKLELSNEKESFSGSLVNGKFEGTWKMSSDKLLYSLEESYKESLSLDGLKNLNMSPLSLTSRDENYSSTLTVIYNKKNIAVTEEFTYLYSGGAHGNYGVSYKTYDTLSNKLITFSDFFDEDVYSSLEKLVKKDLNARSINLFGNDIYVTENIYFTEKGVMFVYNPYEIASYADGIITVFIPYEKIPKNMILKNEITERFVK